MPKLSEATLLQLIANGETNIVELKRASPRPTEMAERLCGMANAQGGIIIVGVEDADLKIIGIPHDRVALTTDVILRAARQIEPKLLLNPPEPEIYEVDGKRLIVATVPRYMERLGSGIRLMLSETRRLGLPVPQFR